MVSTEPTEGEEHRRSGDVGAERASAPRPRARDLTGLARSIGRNVAPYVATHDREGSFVVEGYAALRDARAGLLCVPTELGGWGATLAEAVAFHEELARWCASSSLAFAMHTHAVATQAWRWRHDLEGADR